MTDGDSKVEGNENFIEETVQKFTDKASELLKGQRGERYFLAHTENGPKTSRVWIDHDKVIQLDGIIKRPANITIFTIFDDHIGSSPDQLPPYGFEELVVIRSKHKKPWVFINREETPGPNPIVPNNPQEPRFYDILPRDTDKLSPKALDRALARYGATPDDLKRYSTTLLTLQSSDEIPKPNLHNKPRPPFDWSKA